MKINLSRIVKGSMCNFVQDVTSYYCTNIGAFNSKPPIFTPICRTLCGPKPTVLGNLTAAVEYFKGTERSFCREHSRNGSQWREAYLLFTGLKPPTLTSIIHKLEYYFLSSV